MSANHLEAGDVVLCNFPFHTPQGHEQEGLRPAVITCIPTKVRYPVMQVIPMTTKQGTWQRQNPDTYPIFQKGIAGLHIDSVVLLDQQRYVDENRLGNYLGILNNEEFQVIHEGLKQLC